MEINEPVTVYTASDPVTAKIVKNFLNAEGIRCMLSGENQAAHMGLGGGFAVEVIVPAADADRARKLIEERESRPETT